MPNCNHKYISYLGRQETIHKNKFLYFCTCNVCYSTISIPKKFITDTTGKPFLNEYSPKGGNHVNF